LRYFHDPTENSEDATLTALSKCGRTCAGLR
jgi:hypothetical protein